MKTFVFTRRYQQGKNNVLLCVYRIIKNNPVRMGFVEYNSSASKGAESEVFDFLIMIGEIPFKMRDLSKCSWRGGGYYCPEVEDKGYKIIEL